MTQYDKNIETLNEKYAGMGDLVLKTVSESKEDIEIWEEGEAIITRVDGKEIYLSGKRNRKDPINNWIDSLGKLYINAPILIEGVGNPDYLQELVNYAENKLAILVYEPSIKLFEYFLNVVDLKSMMEKQNIIFWVDGIDGMDEARLNIVINNLLSYEVLNMSRMLIVPNYDVLFPEKTLMFAKLCRNQTKKEASTRNTKKVFSTVVAKNLFSNLKYLVNGYKTVQYAGKIPKGIPGILVAAGPSLNKNISQLKKAKGKAFIIATDTAIKPLLNAGIIPDMFAIVDGKKPLDLVNIDGAQDIPLITTIVAASEILDYHNGKKIFCNEGIYLSDAILNHSKFPHSPMAIGGSVATFAFTFLYMIGVQTVILVGQDLAYTNNRSHADGTFKKNMPEIDTSEFIMVEGNYEDKVPTSGDFKLYLEWYEEYIKGYKETDPEFRVINATEGGAKINGAEISTLEEAIEKECNHFVNIQEIIASIEPMLDKEGKKWAIDYINDIPIKCQSLIKDSSEARKLYQKLDIICKKGNLDINEYKSIIKKIDKIINKIDKNMIYNLVINTLSDAEYIIKNEQHLEYGTVQEEGIEIARKGVLYMDNIRECSKVFSEYFIEVCEEKNKQLFDKILKD